MDLNHKWRRYTTKWYSFSGNAWKEANDFEKRNPNLESSLSLCHKD